MTNSIYLDHSTVAPPSKRVVDEMSFHLKENWGVYTQPHQIGSRLAPVVEKAYRSIYALLEANEEDIVIFTSSGTEAVNQVVQSVYLRVSRETGKNQFITAVTDEAASILAIGRLEQLGCVGKMVPVTKEGCVTAEEISRTITARTALLSLSLVNGLTGVIHPIDEIAKICREREVLLHLDISHAIGKTYFDLQEIGADFITFGGAQIHGPRGSGALWVREKSNLQPLLLGGAQQANFRAGELDVASLAALGVACDEALENRDLLCTETVRLRNYFESLVQEKIADVEIFYQKGQRAPHIASIAFHGLFNEALLYALDREQLFCSMGGGNLPQLSLVLQSAGVKEGAQSALSFSLGRNTSDEEVEQAVMILTSTVLQMRKLSQQIAFRR